MPQDRLLELPQLLARLETELLREVRAAHAVGLEGLGLPAGAVQRQQQLTPQALPQRMLDHEGLQLADELRVPAGGEIGVDALLECRLTQLLEARDLDLREGLVLQVGQRVPAPERQCLAQLLPGVLGVRAASIAEQLLEAGKIELRGLDLEEIAGRPRDEPALAQLLSQPRDVYLDALGRRRRRLVPPELVDQAVGRHDLVRVQEQQREQ